MGPQLLLDTTHLMKYIDAMGEVMQARAAAAPVDRRARAVTEFVQRQHAQIIDLGVALGCAAFTMGVVIGVMLLLGKH